MKCRAATFICIMILMTLYGCSKQYVLQDEEGNLFGTDKERYTVLTFFFDGVPDPEKKAEDADTAGHAGDGKPAKTERARYTEHGPYEAKLCEGCHQRATNKLLMPVEELCLHCHTFKMDKKWVHGPLASGGCRVCHNPHASPYRFLLVSESKEFCFHCHDRNDVLKKDIHKGQDMACTTCHDAHMSDTEFLLK